MIERTLFSEEHNIFRESVQRFYAEEITPNREEWEKALRVTDRLLTLNPGNPEELRDCGRLYDQVGHSEAAFLDYQASLHGLAEDEKSGAIARAIRRTALQDKAAQPIHTLSRGYRQRVGVAQAILHEPDIVILDEPTNGLDPTQILYMRELIRELATSATVIVSTHILQEVQAVCDRVLILRGGKLVVDSRLHELRQGRRLLVSVDGDAGADLAGVDGVAGVEARGTANGRWVYALEADEELAPQVATTLISAGRKLYQLQTEHRDLETVFAEVNELAPSKEVAHG